MKFQIIKKLNLLKKWYLYKHLYKTTLYLISEAILNLK